MAKRAKRISKRKSERDRIEALEEMDDRIDAIEAMDFGPRLTQQQVKELVVNIGSNLNISRHMALAVLSQSKDQLIENYPGLDTYNDALAILDTWKKQLNDCLEMADSAFIRLLSVMATAEKRAEETGIPADLKHKAKLLAS